MTFDEHEAFLAQRERRRFEAFVAGAAGTHITLVTLGFFWKHRAIIIKSLIVLFVGAQVMSGVYIHFLSPQTRDLSSVVEAAKANVSIGSVSTTSTEDGSADHIRARIANNTVARIIRLNIECGHDGTGTRTIQVPIDTIPAHSAADVDFQAQVPLDRAAGVKCTLGRIVFAEADFYRAAHEMDWKGLAAIDDTTLAGQASYNTVKQYDRYSGYITYLSGQVRNLDKSRHIKSLSFECSFRSGYDEFSYSRGEIKNLDIAPGQTYTLDGDRLVSNAFGEHTACETTSLEYAQ